MSKVRYDLAHSVPATFDDFGKPPHRETVEPAESPDSVVGLVEIVAHLLMAMIIFFAMWRSAADVRNALIAAVIYFGLMTTLRILARTHTLSAVWRYWLDYRLERHRIDAYEYLAERKLELEQPRALPADPPQTPAALPDVAPNYVPAYDAQAIDEARAWVLGLYGRDGQLDPRRVRSGYVQGGVVGSKRSGGSADALRLLVDQRVIKPAAGGYRYNTKRLPHRDDVERLFSELQGRPGLVGG